MLLPRTLEDFNILVRRIFGGGNHAKVFDNYYKRNAWIGGGSGSGSTAETTAPYREFLSAFMRDHKITSVVDLGCGDWQFSKLIDWTGIDYTGVDISHVVLENTSKFTKPGIRFLELDGRSYDLPSADLLVSKDVLQHWSNYDIVRFLPVLEKFKFALITNVSEYAAPDVNLNIRPGLCRPVDLTKPPFNVRGKTIFEYYGDGQKSVFLWQRD